MVTTQRDKLLFQKSLLFTLGFTSLLWTVKAVEWSTATDLGIFGILPRTLVGFTGIITGPLIHGDALHLLSNTFPLMMLMLAIFYFYDRIALEVFLWIYLVTGFWVWLAARQAYHIGASGLVYGLASFLFFSGIFRKDARSIAVALCIAFLYGGMLQGIFPSTQEISWESHLLGTAAGILCSFYFKNKKTVVADKKGTISVENHQQPTFIPFSTVSSTYQADGYTTDPMVFYEYTESRPRQSRDRPLATASET